MAVRNDKPRIDRIHPAAAIAGGALTIEGRGLAEPGNRPPRVKIGSAEAAVLVAADNFLVAQIPNTARGDTVRVCTTSGESPPAHVHIGVPLADNLHPVANPAVDREGNIYVTFSGRRGQKVPISVYRIEGGSVIKPYLSDIMNPSGLAFDTQGALYVSSRHEGVVYRVTDDRKAPYAEGMGIATGLAFDADENLYVGDRSGTIFKIGRDRQIFVFATLEPSVAAYHLAFGPDGHLYVAGPTTSSFDSIYRINQTGRVESFYRGLGRPQGLAFDTEGNLYVAASHQGKRGILRFPRHGEPELVISGPNFVGLAFAPEGLVLATTDAVYQMPWAARGFSALP